MNKRVRHTFVQRVLMLAVAGLIAWGLLHVPASADMRIRVVDVSLGFEFPSDILLKHSTVRVANADGSGQIYFCEADELVMLSPRDASLYWQGNTAEFKEQLQAMFAGALSDLSLDGTALWDEAELPDVDLRITELDSDTIAGYSVVQYLVEYNDGAGWRTLENVWISKQLLHEVQAEIGDCMSNLSEALSAAEDALVFVGTDAMLSAASHPAYEALLETGFLMRTVSRLEVFGFAVTVETVVREVSEERLSDELFTVPDGYRRVDSLAMLFGL